MTRLTMTTVPRLLRSAVLLIGAALSGAATGSSYILPDSGNSLVGEPIGMTVTYEDRFATLAVRYDLGFEELRHANPGVDPWIPGEGAHVVLPTQYLLPPGPRSGVVINLPEYRLYYYPKSGGTVYTFPIGIGRSGFKTPQANTQIVAKIVNPTWYPTASARREHLEVGDKLPPAVPPGPDNPLGDLALQLTLPGYFVHGTNRPFGVGQRVSHGCVRLYPPDIHTLADSAPIGTKVRIIDQPYKLGWNNDVLYLEVHPPLEGETDFRTLTGMIEAATAHRKVVVDWARVEEMARASTGMPGPISARPL